MEQLLVQADGLHREAALLSNTLHQYAADDLDGVRPVIGQILAKRQAWKDAMRKMEYVKKTGKLPDPAPVAQVVSAGAVPAGVATPGVAELKLELQRLNVNISKTQRKIQERPDHKKAQQWAVDLDKLEALKTELKQKIVELTYAAT